MTTYLAGVPEFRFQIAEWAERDGTVFVEARNSGRPGGGTFGGMVPRSSRTKRSISNPAFNGVGNRASKVAT